MRKFFELGSLLFVVGFLSQSFFEIGKSYKLIKVVGDERDVQKLFYNFNEDEIPWNAFHFSYSNVKPIPNFYVEQDSQQLYAFRIYDLEDKEFKFENYFQYEKLGSFRDLNQFQWKANWVMISDTIRIRLTNLPETNPSFLKSNSLYYPLELSFLPQ